MSFVACFAPLTSKLPLKVLVLLILPSDKLGLELFMDLNGLSPFPKMLLLKLLALLAMPDGEDDRKVAFPVNALLNKEPVADPSSSSSSPCSSSDEEAAVEESSSPSSALNVM